MSKDRYESSGISFLGLLCLLFIGLKLTGYITWSWLWVLAPIWLPIFVTFFGLVAYMIYVLATRERTQKSLS